MNIFDLNSDNITMNIDGKDIEMKPAICFGKEIDWWCVSKCGKVWSWRKNKLLKPCRGHSHTGRLNHMGLTLRTEEDFWEDGSGNIDYDGYRSRGLHRSIKLHKIVIDTWAPLYDNPPEGVTWEHWEIARDLDTVYNHTRKTGSIDHIDDDPTNNRLDNLRRVNDWDNNNRRKSKGI